MSHPAEEGPIPLAIPLTRARASPPPNIPLAPNHPSYAEAASSFESPSRTDPAGLPTRSRRDPQPPFYSSSPTRVKSSPNPRRRCSQADRGSMPISASLLSSDIFPDSEEEREADNVYDSETSPHTMMTPLLEVRSTGAYQSNPQHRPNEPPCYQDVLLEEEDLHISIIGYHFHRYRLYIYYILCFLTGGILYLLGRWMPRLWVAWVGKACPMGNAEWVVVENGWGEASIEKVNRKLYGGACKNVFSCYDEEEGDQTETDSILQYLHYFDYRYIRFIYHPFRKIFVLNSTWKDPSWTSIAECRTGISGDIQQKRMLLFGPNVIDIREKSISQLLVQEVLHPFYIFQVFSMLLWFLDEYIYYAACIFIISSSSIISTLVDTRRNMRKMREMSRFICDVIAFRDEKWKFIRSNELVPGDVIDISSPSLQIHPCDAILLEGDTIVNESMLTGESVPVSKFPATDKTLRSIDLSALNIPADLAKHVLFAGTKSIRVRVAPSTDSLGSPASQRNVDANGTLNSPASQRNVDANGDGTRALAMVVRTGFNTTKGALVRSMMFPRPNKFQFYRDSFRFIGVLSVLAFVGFLASLYNFIRMGVGVHLIIVRALDLITIVVPPALPATMSIGTGFAIARLRKANIYCISPPRVNICGKLNVICFDKTGTLTEEGLDVLGVRYTQMQTGRLSPLYRNASEIADDSTDTSDESLLSPSQSPTLPSNYRLPPILHIMTTCHSLKHVNGELIGDPLDFKMFEFTHWVLEESGIPLNVQANDSNEAINLRSPQMQNESTTRTRGMFPAIVRPAGSKPSLEDRIDRLGINGNLGLPLELGIIRVFEFVSQLRRMAVIVRRLDSPNMEVFVKGAPEVMREICVADSFPADYEETLLHYTQHGYRVIACAAKPLYEVSWITAQKMKREQVEFDLRFVGFVIFENKIKPGTTPAIKTLRTAKIRQVMCTGDNILTAISVSRECGLVLAHSQVFVPRFAEGSPTEEQSKIVWEPSDGIGANLNPDTLMPDNISRQSNGTAQQYPILGPRDYDLAVNGDAFRWMVDYGSIDTLNKMLVKTAIFARMSPDEKHELVEKLHALDYVVGFCGDGANDCGALKAADVGVSLSEAEASVAAPFTSRTTDVSCVVQTIREGRAALVTSFSCFKYMALYSLIQFTTVTFLYIFASNLGDFQFLYIDLFLIIPIAIFMGHTEPHEKIHAKGPTASLVSKRVLSSLFGHVFLQGFFQWLVYTLVRKQPWYTPPVIDPDEKNISCYENTSLFLFSCFQYVLIAVIFSVGPPYRKKMTSNVPYIVATFGLLLLTAYLVLWPSGWVMTTLELRQVPSSWKGTILFIVGVYFTLAWIGEHLVFPGIVRWYLKVATRKVKLEHKKRYKRIEMQLDLR